MGFDSLFNEIGAYWRKEYLLGRIPVSIELTQEQHLRLKLFSESTKSFVVSLEGEIHASPFFDYAQGMIEGMKYEPLPELL